MNIEWKQEVE